MPTYNETNLRALHFDPPKGLILRRFKARIEGEMTNQSWIVPPPNWQRLVTEGWNIVWNLR